MFLPLKDKLPSKRVPVVTYTLLGLNVVVFLYEMSLPPGELYAFFLQFGVVPLQVVYGQAVEFTGQGFAETAFRLEFTDRLVPFVTSMFLHGGLAHLIGNMLYLHIFGDNIEDCLGHGGFIGFYLISGFAAAGAQIIFAPTSVVPMVGASGAIAGVLGAYMILHPASRVVCLVFLFVFIQLIELPAFLLLALWFVFQFISASGASAGVGGVAYWAHIGGFVVGGVVGVVLALYDRKSRDDLMTMLGFK